MNDPAPVQPEAVTLGVAMKDGTTGIGSTGTCECFTLQVLGRAIERISDGLHAGERPMHQEGT